MWSTIFLGLLILLFGGIVWSFFTRGTPVRDARLLGGSIERLEAEDPMFRETFALVTNTTITPGNRVEILPNGRVYERLWEDIASARDLVTWQVFWFKPGKLADRLAEALIDRARAGVKVLFLYDYFGAKGIPDEYYDRLRDAGVEVVAFRPFRLGTLYKIQQRAHVRTVVIDGRIGYTGGFAIADEWLGDGRHPDQWRDTSVRVEGRLVNQLQSAFVANWAEATGQLLVGDHVFPLQGDTPPGDTCAGLMYDAPSLGSTNAERFFMMSLHGARERLYITNAYFVPDSQFRQELIDAVERGVDVRVLTPGTNSDRMSTYHASRRHYEELLEGGVRIYHYRPTMVHAKTIVADGVWGSVGTINFDNRSMVLNDEVAVVMQDRASGEELERLFLEDLEHADEVDLASVRSRGAVDRLKERFYHAFAPLL